MRKHILCRIESLVIVCLRLLFFYVTAILLCIMPEIQTLLTAKQYTLQTIHLSNQNSKPECLEITFKQCLYSSTAPFIQSFSHSFICVHSHVGHFHSHRQKHSVLETGISKKQPRLESELETQHMGKRLVLQSVATENNYLQKQNRI